ncbi:MAG: hypothetical protein ACRC35_03865 [Angustibacter sp.]
MSTTTPRELDVFESALLRELRTLAVDNAVDSAIGGVGRPAVARRPRRRLAALAATTATAASVAIGVGVAGGSPAFAVQRQADGDVVVTITRLEDADGLEEAMSDQGIPADVSYSAADMIDARDSGEFTVTDGGVGRMSVFSGNVPADCTEGGFLPHVKRLAAGYEITLPQDYIREGQTLRVRVSPSFPRIKGEPEPDAEMSGSAVSAALALTWVRQDGRTCFDF